MDNKQKKRILVSIYKATLFFAFCAIVWTGYFAINNFINNVGNLLWLDVVLLSVAFLLLIEISLNASKAKKLKNLFSLSKFLFGLAFLIVTGIIVGAFFLYYTNTLLSFGYFLTLGLVIFALALAIFAFIVSLKLAKLHKGTSVYIEADAPAPNYDDELMLKKKLDELQRKREMQKVVNEIEAIKNELGEN